MNAKHAPGPWQAVPTHFNEGYTVLSQPHAALRGFTKLVAFVGDKADEETHANARLIAAAPDMAAALDRIFSYVSYVNIHGVGEQPEPREDGLPQPMRVPPEEFARIFKEIGKLASGALSKAGA